MKSRLSLTLAATLFLASLGMFTVSANSRIAVPARIQAQAAATAPTCSDATLLSGIATDLQTIAADISKIPSTGAGGVYSIMVDIANARLKYENMPTPSDLGCSYLVTETIILFADVQDLGLINMGTKLGLDTSADQPGVLSRLQNQLQTVTNLVGVATPAAS